MKKYLWIIVMSFGVLQATEQVVCNIGCLLVQGPEYQYGDQTFGQWDPSRCCVKEVL